MLSSLRMKWAHLAASLVLIAGCATAPPSVHARTAVEIWRGGDDGLTLHFFEALEARFAKSAQFFLVQGAEPSALIVTIESNLHWKNEGGRLKASYRVSFTDSRLQRLGGVQGECWEDDFDRCADSVVGEASRTLARNGASGAK